MFLDIQEFRVENKTKNIYKKTVLVMWSKTCGKMAKIVCKVTKKKKFVKF